MIQVSTPFVELIKLDMDYDVKMGYELQLVTVTVKYDRLSQAKSLGIKLKNTLEGAGKHRTEIQLVRDGQSTSALLVVNIEKTNAKLVIKTPDNRTRSYKVWLDISGRGAYELGAKSTEFQDVLFQVEQYVPEKVLKTEDTTTTTGAKASLKYGGQDLATANIMLEVCKVICRYH